MGLPKIEGKRAKHNRYGEGVTTDNYQLRLPEDTIKRIREEKIDVGMLIFQAIHTGSVETDNLLAKTFYKTLLVMRQENITPPEGFFNDEEWHRIVEMMAYGEQTFGDVQANL